MTQDGAIKTQDVAREKGCSLQDAAKWLRANGYFRKIHKGEAVWTKTPPERRVACMPGELLAQRVALELSRNEAISTRALVHAIGRERNAWIASRVEAIVLGLGWVRSVIDGKWVNSQNAPQIANEWLDGKYTVMVTPFEGKVFRWSIHEEGREIAWGIEKTYGAAKRVLTRKINRIRRSS